MAMWSYGGRHFTRCSPDEMLAHGHFRCWRSLRVNLSGTSLLSQ